MPPPLKSSGVFEDLIIFALKVKPIRLYQRGFNGNFIELFGSTVYHRALQGLLTGNFGHLPHSLLHDPGIRSIFI